VKGGYADNQDIADFIFPGAFNQLRLTADTLKIGMRGVLVADRDDICGLFAQGIAQLRGEGVRDDDSLIAFNPETRVT